MMNKHYVGDLLRRAREQSGVTQTQLAKDSGVSRVTISRIESGKQVPTHETLRMLLEKLGVDHPTWLSNELLSKEEADAQVRINELDGHLANMRIKEADKLILQLESDDAFMQASQNKQYILFATAIRHSISKSDAAFILGLLRDAISINIHNYCDAGIHDYLLSNQDLGIICLMATTYYENDDLSKAIAIMTALKENFDEHCADENHRGKHYPFIVYNLTKYLGLSGNHLESLQLCDKGIDVCIQTKYLALLPEIYFNKAYCLYHLGQKEESAVLFRDVCHTLKLYRRADEMNYVKSYVLEKTDIAFDLSYL